MKFVLTIAGILMLVAGLFWVGQGLGLISGSYMTGDMKWTYIGALAAIVGIGIIYYSRGRN